MAVISQQVPNLLGGINQQPDPVKLPGQVVRADNVLLDPTFGARKRPPLQFVGQLADDIPDDAKWFNIFRDNNERYVACIYNDGALTLRVWAADSATEITVNAEQESLDYLDSGDLGDITHLTVNDYTFLANRKRVVSMSDNSSSAATQEALIVINQVAYNTTYKVNFFRDGTSGAQVKVYRAVGIQVSPSTWEDTTTGGCPLVGTNTFLLDSGAKTDLGFRLTINCNPTQVTKMLPGDYYPTSVDTTFSNVSAYCDALFGAATTYQPGTFQYRQFTNSQITVRLEFRVTAESTWAYVSSAVLSYDPKAWAVGMTASDTQGGQTATCTVTAVGQGPETPDYSYKSVYTATAQLTNSGSGWRVGDTVTANLNGKDFTITVTGENFTYSFETEATASYTTPVDNTGGSLDISSIVGELVTDINALTGYEAQSIGNVIYVERTDGRDFNLNAVGGTANQACYSIKGFVNDISRLPTQCVDGMVVGVRNSIDSDKDDYFVKFKSATPNIPGEGAWEECVGPGVPTDLNASSMPQALIRESDGEFTLRPLSPAYSSTLCWASRTVGNQKTNPDPSFVGRTIYNMVLFQNRLGLLSEDTIIMSQPGDFFNFFVGSAIAVADSDPIDMSASTTKPAMLKHAVGTPSGLLLFSENNQFLLSTQEESFGPSTAKMNEIASYSYRSKVPPVETGVSILFSTEADTYSKVFELAIESLKQRPLVAENTRIVPQMIPPSLTIAAASPNNSLIVYGNDSGTMWVFRYFNVGNERSMAGWTRWIFDCPVRMLAFDHDTGYFVQRNGDSYILNRMEMQDDPDTSPLSAFGFNFMPRLDNYLQKGQLTLAEATPTSDTKVRFEPGQWVSGAEALVVFVEAGTGTTYQVRPVSNDGTSDYVQLSDADAAKDFVLGISYDMEIELPRFYLKAEDRADRKNIPVVEMVYLSYYYSGRYNVTLSRQGYDELVLEFPTVRADLYATDSVSVDEDGTHAIPVFCLGDVTTITISSPDPLPSSILGYAWEGHYNNRGIRFIK